MKKNIVVLISGRGSNLKRIYEVAKQDNWSAAGIEIAAVISNKAEAGGLKWAQEQSINTHVLNNSNFASREAFDTELMQLIDKYQPALIVLAGFMRILTPEFINHYPRGTILNIHPSLLPLFKGTKVHERVLAAGCSESGATVHEVTAELDSGKILAQAKVKITATDTVDSLAAKVLEQEHIIYPQAIWQKLSGKKD